MSNPITITMSRKNALALGLLICKCGHPLNGHFDVTDRRCAHCKCKKYREIARRGKLIKYENNIVYIVESRRRFIKNKLEWETAIETSAYRSRMAARFTLVDRNEFMGDFEHRIAKYQRVKP